MIQRAITKFGTIYREKLYALDKLTIKLEPPTCHPNTSQKLKMTAPFV